MCVCMHITCLGATEAKKGHHFPWIWSYRWVMSSPTWVLGNKFGFVRRAISSLSQRAIYSPTFMFLIRKLSLFGLGRWLSI